MSRPRRIYAAFEGGGARGVSHVGALAALEAAEARGEIEIRGYAGTSAGALVAALAAAGWRSEELVDVAGGTTILDTLLGRIEGRRPTAVDLVGRGAWARLAVMRAVLGPGLVRLVLTVAAAALVLMGLALVLHVEAALPAWWIWVGAAGVVLAARVCLDLGRGVASLDPLRDLMAKALARKLRKIAKRKKEKLVSNHPTFREDPKLLEHLLTVSGDPTFREIYRVRGVPLRIVTADVTNGRLRLFPDRPEDEDVPVSAVVAASAAVPLAFGARRIPGQGEALFLDGGLVSNLPAWAFDYELRLDEEASVCAIEIEDEPLSGPLALRLVRTAIFGSKPMALRNIPQLHTVTLPSRLGMLELDAPFAAVAGEIAAARQRAEGELILPLVGYGTSFDQLAETARQLFREALAPALEGGAYAGTLRAAFAVPFGEPELGLRVRYTAGYEASPELCLSLPMDDSISGCAYLEDRVYAPDGIAIYDETRPWAAKTLRMEHYRVARNRTKAVPPGEKSKAFIAAMRVPLPKLVRVSAPAYVLQVDGDMPLDLADPEIREVCALVRDQIAKAIADHLATPGERDRNMQDATG